MKNQIENAGTPNVSLKLLEIGGKKQVIKNELRKQEELFEIRHSALCTIAKEYRQTLHDTFRHQIGSLLVDWMIVENNFESFIIRNEEHRELFAIHCDFKRDFSNGKMTTTRDVIKINYYTGGSTNEATELIRLMVIGKVAEFILNSGATFIQELEKVDADFIHYETASSDSYSAMEECNRLKAEIRNLDREWAMEYFICDKNMLVAESKKSIACWIPGNKNRRYVAGVSFVSKTEKAITLNIKYQDADYTEDKKFKLEDAENLIYSIYKTHDTEEA